MKLYILEAVERCTDNYHDGGGLVIIAEDLHHAKQMIEKVNRDRIDNQQSHLYTITTEQWHGARELILFSPAEPEIIVFPDAGCC